MEKIFLVITSISSDQNKIIRQIAGRAKDHGIPLILVGDRRSPVNFNIEGCDFYSIEQQLSSGFELAKHLPENHYSRKNLGYLISMSKGSEIIIETDDDNFPGNEFWNKRILMTNAHPIENCGWINIYKYFTDHHIWPRGFNLRKIADKVPPLMPAVDSYCPIQQGLSDSNPDVDAIYRMISHLPFNFYKSAMLSLGFNAWCPFNSQNTTWFKEAFPLMYLPSYCSFRMTDIWRSFIAQRIAWTCNWKILFHSPTTVQERNDHDLMIDFKDEIPGYLYNEKICDLLQEADFKNGQENIFDNLMKSYHIFVDNGFIDKMELKLVNSWIHDCQSFI